MSYGAAYPTDENDAFLQNYNLPLKFITSAREAVFINGVLNLRSNKGALYVWAAGNEYDVSSLSGACGTGEPLSCTEASIDNKNGLPWIIPVGALDANGVKSPLQVLLYGGFHEYGYDGSVYSASGDEIEPAIMTVDRTLIQKLTILCWKISLIWLDKNDNSNTNS